MNFGLVGKRLSHSFSKDFFTQKFKKLNFKSHNYENYEIDNLNELRELIKKNQLYGLNVTIPFKQEIIKYLDEIESNAWEINSVNTIKVENNKLIGYNSDIQGFENSFIPIIGERQKAIVLGKSGETIKKIRMSSQKEMIDIFDTEVHLFIEVKVRKNWVNDPRVYEEWGLKFDIWPSHY